MIANLPRDHPYWHVKTIINERFIDIKSIYFSYYEYIPQSLLDNREVFSISAREFLDEEKVSLILKNTPENRELSIHSAVEMNQGGIQHIPMADMSTGSIAQIEKLRPFLGDDLFNRFEWYKSGRSFHGYGLALIADKEWVSLMGTFLLANQKGLAPTVDPRWVGHRLVAGYSALRWTKNTEHYLRSPQSIK